MVGGRALVVGADGRVTGPPVIRRLRERRADLARVTIRRALAVPLVVLSVTLAAFVMADASPLNPLAAQFGEGYERMTDAERTAAATALGADRPWWQAWAQWIAGLATGDAGYSPTYRQPVLDVLTERLPWTVGLSAVGLGIALVVVVLSGLIAAARPHGAVDRALAGAAVTLSSIPTFALALGSVAVFSVALGWLPVSGAAPPGQAATVGGVVRYGILALPDLECVDPVLELTGVDERPQYVVLEVAEAQSDSSQVFEASVDGLDGAVGRFASRNQVIVWCERSFLPCVVGLPGSPVIGMVPREARNTSTFPIVPPRSWLKADELSDSSS